MRCMLSIETVGAVVAIDAMVSDRRSTAFHRGNTAVSATTQVRHEAQNT